MGVIVVLSMVHALTGWLSGVIVLSHHSATSLPLLKWSANPVQKAFF